MQNMTCIEIRQLTRAEIEYFRPEFNEHIRTCLHCQELLSLEIYKYHGKEQVEARAKLRKIFQGTP